MLKQTLFLNVSHYLLALTLKYCQPTFFDRGVLFISGWQKLHNAVLRRFLHGFYLYTLF